MLPLILVVGAYLCGSIPTGAWLGRRAGVDVQRTGSRNIGATNVARTVGLRPALLTLVGDIMKGFIPVLVSRALLANPWLIALVGSAAFFGHLFSIFLRFSGGKGVATGFGIFLGLAPAGAAVAAIVFAVVVAATRYVSLASVLAAASLPAAAALLGSAAPTVVAAAVTSAAIIVRHRGNLVRLWAGVEPQFRLHR
jgi:glycerol-3-phosphate acyltransferase PlsY